ncbi:MAG: hypothetical protein ACYC3L_00520 [Gemmatimonadaceae bacterium]
MTPNPLNAIDRLEYLASLFVHARQHSQGDAIGMSELLDEAQRLLGEIGPVVAAARNTPYEAAVLQAAMRARASHAELAADMGYEIAAIAGELRQLTAGAEAANRYVQHARQAPAPEVSRIG